jgi:hypothetical protein
VAAAKEAHAIYLQKLAQGILTRLPGTYVHEPAATLEALEPYERQASAYLRGLDPEDRPRLEQLVAECTRTLAALMDADARTSVLDSPNEREEMFRDLAGVYLRATDVVLSVCKAGWVAMTARLGRAEVLRRLAAGGTPEQARLLEAALAVLRVLKREWPDAKAHAPNPVRRAEFEFLMHNGLACVMGDQTMSCHAGGKGDRRWTEVAAELQEVVRIVVEESVDPRLVVVC